MILKFKGWHTKIKRWYILAGFPDPIAAKDFIIVQFTQYYDIKGTEIYNGDVLYGKVGKRKVKHVVEFITGETYEGEIMAGYYLGDYDFQDQKIDAKIIGNVNEGEWAWTPRSRSSRSA